MKLELNKYSMVHLARGLLKELEEDYLENLEESELQEIIELLQRINYTTPQ